jgi:hypothetical protein
LLVGLILVVGLLVGCGSSTDAETNSDTSGNDAGASLTEPQLKNALAALPLTIDFHDEQSSGKGAAVGGTATDGSANVQFEIVSGSPDIGDPLFPQGDIGLHAQRGVGNGYTITFSRSESLAEGRREARISTQIEGKVCELAHNCPTS